MSATTPSAPPTGRVPLVPRSMTRAMAVSVAVVNAGAMIAAAGVVAATGRADWWPAWVAAAAIGLVGAAASAVVLTQAAGRGVDWLPTFVLGATACRLGVSAVGLLVALYAARTPPEPTAFLICLFYAMTLVAETVSLRRAVGGQASVGGAHV